MMFQLETQLSTMCVSVPITQQLKCGADVAPVTVTTKHSTVITASIELDLLSKAAIGACNSSTASLS